MVVAARRAEDFPSLLRYYRDRTTLSCNELARLISVDPSYVSRLERGEREPPRRPIVDRLCQALRLSLADQDRLLIAAGYTPTSVAALGRWDTTLQEVADVLTDGRISIAELETFRQVIHLIAARWTRAAPEGRPPG